MWLRLTRPKSDELELDGYQNDALVEIIVRKTVALTKAHRIDAIVPGEVLLPTLTAVAATADQSRLSVVDFGGAAGLHYLAVKQAFPTKKFRWAVVETAEMVAACSDLAQDELRFFLDLASARTWLGQVDLVHSVSALQYVTQPEAALAELLSVRARTVLWVKLMLGERRETFVQTSRLQDNGPGPLPAGIVDRRVTYSATRLPREEFIHVHQQAGYRLAWKAQETDSFLFLLEDAMT